ncbi:MAG: MOSC domain-containing protein, partial [Woeseiaceae bacterium]|nr:MOSC domain-containing protein [Woeseiaceae bacterium]
MPTMQELIDTLPQRGSVEWIGLRPERRAAVERVSEAEISTDHGLAGDHYGKAGGKRQVTLIQGEHLDAIASILGVDAVDPGALRRNIVV